MNVENAKKLKLPDAQKIFEQLEKARNTRIQERQSKGVSVENPSSDEQGVQTIENSKNTASLREMPVSTSNHISNPRPSSISSTIRRICCCFRAYRVIPDATITIEK